MEDISHQMVEELLANPVWKKIHKDFKEEIQEKLTGVMKSSGGNDSDWTVRELQRLGHLSLAVEHIFVDAPQMLLGDEKEENFNA